MREKYNLILQHPYSNTCTEFHLGFCGIRVEESYARYSYFVKAKISYALSLILI